MRIKKNNLLLMAGIAAFSILSTSTIHAGGARTPQLASEVDRHEPLTAEQIQERYEQVMNLCGVLVGGEKDVCEQEAEDKRKIELENAELDRQDAEKREQAPVRLRKSAY